MDIYEELKRIYTHLDRLDSLGCAAVISGEDVAEVAKSMRIYVDSIAESADYNPDGTENSDDDASDA